MVEVRNRRTFTDARAEVRKRGGAEQEQILQGKVCWWVPGSGSSVAVRRCAEGLRKSGAARGAAQPGTLNSEPRREAASAGAEVEGFDVFATGEQTDLRDDLFAMMEELVAHDGVAGEDDEAVALDGGGVRIGGVGDTDDLTPVIANGLLGGFAADVVLVEQLLDEDRERLGGAFDGAARVVRREPAAQIADELFGEFAENVRLWVVGHGGGLWTETGIFNHG